MVIYLDTSALLKLYVEEEGRWLVREAVSTAEAAATSVVAYAEARAGFARRCSGRGTSPKTNIERWSRI